MAITSTGLNAATNQDIQTSSDVKDKTKLGKDDFMKLLLVQLQYQDPTEPMDTEKILTQTSQLATLEASDNTKSALEKLAASLGTAQQFSTIAAIGKTADLGSDSIAHDKGSSSTFEVYFPNDVQNGSVEIKDNNGNLVKTLDVGTNPKGVYQFTWDGSDNANGSVESGIYHVSATYEDSNNNVQNTRLGAYPIESVRFDSGKTLVKLGSNYVPLDSVKEVY
ncbi:FlgD immunoglobulin-like domain containing protein [Sulfurimonas paralvinellae]|uniref:Basal-body rod modification protein FlgD n=1 Tax=Sulfurimonas paralvinellae TaxID=317658 RepID=A0A7M1B4Y9_9BACT|nr:FlgD immunoglobulin-like domain containing protein [Sulfurimonas paralvinellae]QOP44807.1 flagellar hook capping protein [Sulfurimonas paralvinellae]